MLLFLLLTLHSPLTICSHSWSEQLWICSHRSLLVNEGTLIKKLSNVTRHHHYTNSLKKWYEHYLLYIMVILFYHHRHFPVKFKSVCLCHACALSLCWGGGGEAEATLSDVQLGRITGTDVLCQLRHTRGLPAMVSAGIESKQETKKKVCHCVFVSCVFSQ